ncbi:MAG: DinB family protein, partial [Acidobacteriota bacterium]|nr:DinB family protein [Acidobacteriota bacterium]
RLMTYVTGAQLSPGEISEAKAEKEPGATREMLLAAIDAAFEKAESTARDLDPATLTAPRTVGRKQLPTTVIGLLVHTAEHTQRHVGQAISAAKWARHL